MSVLSLATSICQTLQTHGYIAYFAGGWVRDFLLGIPCDDIDIATDASPEVIIDLFPKTYKVGIQFGVVLVKINGHTFEVATFRKDLFYEDGRRPEKIVYADAIEDAKRRDFTINGMFYDPISKKIYDFVGGERDIQNQCIRAIGDPKERFKEDRLRMIRAIRFACRFGYNIESKTLDAIRDYADQLYPAVSKERVLQELQKMTVKNHLGPSLLLLNSCKLLTVIFPTIELKNLPEKVQCYSNYPKDCPLILYLAPLFNLSLESLIQIFKDLKMTNKDLKLLELYIQTQEALQKTPPDLVQWTYLFAEPQISLCLDVLLAFQPKQKRNVLAQELQSRKSSLQDHINRFINHEPLVTSQDILELGILPGKQMGKLLKIIEKAVIEKNITSKQEALKIVKDYIENN